MGFTELRSQPLSPTRTHPQALSPTPNRFHPLPPIFDKNDLLPYIFQEKQPPLTHFSRKATHSHPFSDKNDTLLPIFWQ